MLKLMDGIALIVAASFSKCFHILCLTRNQIVIVVNVIIKKSCFLYVAFLRTEFNTLGEKLINLSLESVKQ